MNFEEIKKQVKKITPMQWVFIAVSLGVAIYIFFPRSNQSTALTSDNMGYLGGGSLSGGDSGGGSSSTDNSLIEQVINDAQQGFDSLTGEYNKIATQFADYQANTSAQIDALNANYNLLSNDYAIVQEASSINIYQNALSDANRYNEVSKQISSAVSSGTVSPSAGTQAKTILAGLGNDGVGNSGKDYDKAKTESFYSDVSKNSGLKQSEIERTNAVIANRKAQGLDTTNQTNYLKIITKL